ncbi:MAG: TetR/AcrR family transcriptional regulator [Pseudomonadota bacterium]
MNISPTVQKKRESYHHGDLRAQLIEATRQLVEEKGPDRFSVAEACRRARVSTAAPYKHFKDKTEMLLEVAADGMRRHATEMIEVVAPFPQGTLERIIALGRIYIRFAVAEPGVFRLMFSWADEDQVDELLTGLGEGTYTFVKLEVAKCLGRDHITEEDERRALMLWSMVHGMAFLSIDNKLKNERVGDDLEPLLADIAARVLPEAKSA